MEQFVLRNQAGKDITTSLIIADVFGKEHNKVCRDIENLPCREHFRSANFGVSSYITSKGKELPLYEITKNGFLFLTLGYTGEKAGEFKEKFIAEFDKRGVILKNDDYIIGRALSLLAQHIQQKEELLRLQDHVIKENATKVEYYKEVLQSEGIYTTIQVARKIDTGAITATVTHTF